MNLLSPHIAAHLFDTPLMVAPEKLSAMLMGLGGRVVEGGVVLMNSPAGLDHSAFAAGRPSMGVLKDATGPNFPGMNAQGFQTVNNVAVIAIEGTLVQKGAWIGQSSGQTSFQGLQVQLAKATQAARAKTITGAVLEIDSFGGQVSGAFETADMVAQLSKLVPTMAILTDAAASCGYLQASQCRQIVMPESGTAGSIGCVSLHIDYSGKLDKDGVAVTMITAGEHKGDGNPFQPLDPEFHAKLQARNEAARQQFAAYVGRGRKARLTKAAALATEARAYFGPDALNVGLVDAIGPAQEAFAAFIKAVNA